MDSLILSLNKFNISNNAEEFEIELSDITDRLNQRLLEEHDEEWEIIKENYSKLKCLCSLLTEITTSCTVKNFNLFNYEKFNLILTKIAEDIDIANLRYLNSIDWEEAKKIVDSSINIECLLRKSINNNNTYLKIDYCLDAYNIFIPIIEDFRGETCNYDEIKDEQFVKEIDSLKRKRN
jgi:hypothetical protein